MPPEVADVDNGIDASLDEAVAAIAGKLRAGNEPERKDTKDTRENREDRDPIERDTSTDLDEIEREERQQAKGGEGEKSKQGDKPDAEAESEEGDKADADAEADAFIELPPEEEGGEPLRIPAPEAAEAWKQLRQMNGDIATAVIKAEEEAFQKQDQLTQELAKTFAVVQEQAKIALQMMHAYAPNKPDPRDFATTEDYYNAQLDYDAYVAHYNKVAATAKQADGGVSVINGQQDATLVARETERTARFIPEFKDEKTREARKAEILDVLGKRYGVTAADLGEVVDHKAWRIMNDLAKTLAAEKKAPEVRKHLKETKARIVNGRAQPSRDAKTGRFVDDARKELRETGSEAAFARVLMRSGELKNL